MTTRGGTDGYGQPARYGTSLPCRFLSLSLFFFRVAGRPNFNFPPSFGGNDGNRISSNVMEDEMSFDYDPEEFVAHASNVNCLKIGRKSSRVLVTGGEDHKVNLWAIGKPNAILSLSGHTSAVESVNFDSSEVLVAAGAASGTIKLWDLEEAKVVRTLTGHRSNCISVDFHPFGEFFASGSLDTNLKIWDIRRKGCIHTYKGHTRGVNAIRFTPDGRWVVSGGEDNSVKVILDLLILTTLFGFIQMIKTVAMFVMTGMIIYEIKPLSWQLWDLTAGKLLHDFKYHEGQVQCIDFHPHEFLLATGSADRTVKFWDLETFELIGSAGPERIEPYLIASSNRLDCLQDSRSSSNAILSGLTDNSGKNSLGRLSISTSSDPTAKEVKPLGRLSVSQNPETMVKEAKPFAATGSVPGTPQKVGLNTGPKSNTGSLASAPSTGSLRRSSLKTHSTNIHVLNKSEVVPVIVPRTSTRIEQAADSRKEICAGGRTAPCSIQSRGTDVQKILTNMGESDRPNVSLSSGIMGCKTTELNEDTDQNFISIVEGLTSSNMPERNGIDANRCEAHGKCRLNTSMEAPAGYQLVDLSASNDRTSIRFTWYTRGRLSSSDKQTVSASDDDAIADLLEQHDQFLGSMQDRLTKSQKQELILNSRTSKKFSDTPPWVLLRYIERNDIKGTINAMEKLADHAVVADITSILAEKTEMITLEFCTHLLPLLTGLLASPIDSSHFHIRPPSSSASQRLRLPTPPKFLRSLLLLPYLLHLPPPP
ncbi:hypothetical protein Sjap_014411 [Stephania japonica]|uniref:Katanin p80 subunit C-terminal domain-containing protein n=1 Tax=Stephania japonica TaxID=461633 RepID=A0AAP0NRF4_9MAGN